MRLDGPYSRCGERNPAQGRRGPPNHVPAALGGLLLPQKLLGDLMISVRLPTIMPHLAFCVRRDVGLIVVTRLYCSQFHGINR
jgi:hypothetical protein